MEGGVTCVARQSTVTVSSHDSASWGLALLLELDGLCLDFHQVALTSRNSTRLLDLLRICRCSLSLPLCLRVNRIVTSAACLLRNHWHVDGVETARFVNVASCLCNTADAPSASFGTTRDNSFGTRQIAAPYSDILCLQSQSPSICHPRASGDRAVVFNHHGLRNY
jgi:hypothetical protein